ncbi:MAG: hypothetical protein ACI9YR_002433 [Bacteroidia bacterium]
METGGVGAYDEASNSFLPVDVRYAKEMAELVKKDCAV